MYQGKIANSPMKITDSFWKERMDIVKNQMIPYQWDALNDRLTDTEPSHAIENFRIAAGESDGEFYGMVFQDSDVAKWLEAVAYLLENEPDDKWENTADEVIDLLEKAQGADGYLNTYYTVKEPNRRWTNLRDNHELYCAGHLIEAAVAYYRATGKGKFLNIMIRYADYIDEMFGPEDHKINGYPGHQEIELSLVKLYEVTNNEKYLKLSKFFIDERGKQPHYFDMEKQSRKEGKPYWFSGGHRYSQSHLPVREQETATGHAVRAVYMYSAMADLAAYTNDSSLKETCEKLWNNVTNKQMYLTAGIGSMEYGEAFSFDYDLPNDLSYTETCASIGLIFWAKRMLELEAHHKYADVMERALYNGAISGMDLEGQKFFYVNPLEVVPQEVESRNEKKHVKPVRQKWYGCACCPPNLARLIASIHHYIYTKSNEEIFVHLYMGNETTMEIGGHQVGITQKTNYPWDGKVAIELSPEVDTTLTLALRIPGWAVTAEVKVNGEIIDFQPIMKNGYAFLSRTWKQGDTVKLNLDMPIQRVRAHPAVRHSFGKVALQRGPLVYCLEQVDHGEQLHSIYLPKDADLKAEYERDLLGGIVTLFGEAERVDESEWQDGLYGTSDPEIKPIQLKAIPYYAWCNREPGEVVVWINEKL
ncbi:glycoside hydrolase family 127 protein [Halobacillus sp. H74]|uniref:glycoside hydrolase family 127 protein n=1 Tax=Halobacillus sp. H74 TaxID=3457436 RepID=UPI003FCEC0EB